MQRILMVSDVFFPRVNGVSTSMQTFRTGLVQEGIQADLVVPRYDREAIENGVFRVKGRSLPQDPEDRLVSWRKMHRAVHAAAAGCDLIHIQTPFVAHYAGLAAARAHGVPVVVTYHTLFEEYLQHYIPFLPAGWLKGTARKFSRKQCNQVDAVIVPSSAMAERLHQYGVTTPVQVLPTGIPLARFAHGDGSAFRARHQIDPARPLALFVGRVAHEKNIGFLIEALGHAHRLCPAAMLLISGDGPAQDDLRAQVGALGMNDAVRFLGYLDRDTELIDCYAAADTFVFASRTETQGLVLLEALAAGRPVVALSIMGTTDILTNTPACFTPPDDPAAFGECLGALLADRDSCLALSDQARLSASRWSDATMASRLAAFYRKMIASHGAIRQHLC